MLAARPLLSGSVTETNTTGTVRDSNCSASDIPEPEVRITFGAERTNSAATARKRADGSVPQCSSMRILRPSIQPSFSNASRNAARRARASGSSGNAFAK